MRLIDRYRGGEREEVWDELVALGTRVRAADLLPEALEVADETMDRARRNVERLVGLLPTIGWAFQRPSQGAPGFCTWSQPSAETSGEIARIESELQGPIPISLAAWWRIVGAVDLTRRPGSGPAVEYPDPLVVLPPPAVLEELHEWQDDEVMREMRPRFQAPLAPDAYHKEDVSGGAPYEIELPDPGADGAMLNLTDQITFVGYLRHAFIWAGLPGYAEVYAEPPPELKAIAQQLEAL